MGPYCFVRYIGRQGLTAEIQAANGALTKMCSAHLQPMLAERSPRLDRWPERIKPSNETPSHASEDPTLSDSLEDAISGNLKQVRLDSESGDPKRLREF